MSQPMTRARFALLLEAYGSKPSRWPNAERDAALALVAADPAMQAEWQQAKALDSVLDALPPPQPVTARDVAEVMAGLPAAASATPASTWLGELWLGIGGWRLAGPAYALALVAGLATGLGLQTLAPQTGSTLAAESELDWWQLSQIEGSSWTQLADTP